MPKIVKAAALAVALLTSTYMNAVTYPKVNPNVSYDAVTSLPFKDADNTVPYGADALQFGKLWLAKEGNDKPLVVFIHGGCWLSAYDITHSYPLTNAIAQAGFHVWSLEYRRTGNEGGGWPGTYEDILAGIAATKDLAKRGVESSAVLLVGHSAGGHLAVLAGSDWQAKLALQEINIAGVIGLAAITDIVAYSKGENSCETATPQFMGGTVETVPEHYAKANPAVKTPMAATYLLQGKQDTIVSIEHAELGGAKAHYEQGAGHFDWVHPGSPAFQTLLATLAKFTPPEAGKPR